MAEHRESQSEESRDDGGTIIRGADGALYYVPDAELKAFLLPEEKAAVAREVLDQQENVSILNAFRGELVRDKLGLAPGGSTTVSVVNIGAARQWRV